MQCELNSFQCAVRQLSCGRGNCTRVRLRTEVDFIIMRNLADQCVQDLLFSLEVLIKRGAFQPGFFRNCIYTHAVVALFGKQREC